MTSRDKLFAELQQCRYQELKMFNILMNSLTPGEYRKLKNNHSKVIARIQEIEQLLYPPK